MDKRRVAVTGIGTVSGYGVGTDLMVDSLFEGQTCIRRIADFDPSYLACQIGAEVPPFDAAPYFKNPRDARRLDECIIQAVVAAKLALEHAGFGQATAPDQLPVVLRERTGIHLGSGIGGLMTLQTEIYKAREKGANRLSPLFIVNAITNMPAGMIAVETGAMGPCMCVVTACATSGHCLGEAMREIQHGRADLMLAGGTERAITDIGVGGFCSMKAITTEFNDCPEKASRPFDAQRSGFVMSEGAGVFVLEEWEHAKRRGVPILGEIVGYGASVDAYHVTAPAPDGAGAQLAMRNCLEDAGLAPEALGYINAHGTSTQLNDKSETAAIRAVFGTHADKLKVSSTKSMHGHMLGAAAAAESAACVYALLRREVPPTINYDNPDPDCDLDYVPNKAQPYDGEYAMCNTFGFGGQNAVLIFKRVT
jgi:3-oxoacyl-[acyl-carrier-protein] synthase II